MKILRTDNPDASLLLLPWYVEFDQTRAQIGLSLNERMKSQPDDILVLLITDDEAQKILGFAVSYIRYEDVFLWQAKHSGLNRREVDEVFKTICLWAKNKGFNKISAIPNRNPKIWERRWGFIKSINDEVVKEI